MKPWIKSMLLSFMVFSLVALAVNQPITLAQQGASVTAETFSLPANLFGITGTVTGQALLITKTFVRPTPVLLLQQAETPVAFDLGNLDPDAESILSIPVDVKKNPDGFNQVNRLITVGTPHFDADFANSNLPAQKNHCHQ